MEKIPVIVVLVTSVIGLKADEAPFFQASLTPDIAIYSKDTEIHGLTLSIWGENPQRGVALGFVNGSSGESAGFIWGLFNYSESYSGVSWGLVNVSSISFHGWQSGWVNVVQGEFVGFQSGWLVNYAKEMRGFQLGLINYSENLYGLQIGLANIAMNNPWFTNFPDKLATGFPIVNWSF
ncbi:MAG: hypothetical protein WDN00_18435 [Limisphaerales bacterium]